MTACATLPAHSSRRTAWMLALLALAQLIIALDATIVFVALPAIGAALRFSAQQLQWVISAYTVAFGGALLLGGRATDLLGRRRMYVLGQALYALSSLAAGLAPTSGALIAARAAQGLGGAFLFPATLALINTHFAEGPARNRALAIWSAASAAGLALGALLGGVLTEGFGWQAIFFACAPLSGAAALAAGALIPRDAPRERARRFDLAGALTVTSGATLLVFGLVQGPDGGFLAPPVPAALAGAVALLALFVVIELRGRDPLMPLHLLRNPNLRAAMVLTCVFMSSFGAQYYFLALYYQQVYGYSVLQTGLAYLPATLLCTVGIHLSTRLLPRLGARATLAAGLALGALGLGWIVAALPAGRGFALLLPGIAILSVGQGITWTAMWITAASGVAPREQGVASGMASTAQQIGSALGLAALVALANHGTLGRHGAALALATEQGLRAALAGTALVALSGVLVALRIRRTAAAPTQPLHVG
jgi:EmrB/QacA subfamily drug resistance transporter